MDELTKTLNSQAYSLKSLVKSIKKIETEETDLLKRLSTLHDEIPRIEKQLQHLMLEQPLIAGIHQKLFTWKEETQEHESHARAAFGRELEQLLMTHGYVLEGNYPKLKTSFYTILVDTNSNRVTLYYGPEVEKIVTCKALPAAVCDGILKYDAILADRVLDEDTFLANLFDAYSVCLQRSNKKVGARVSIPDILSTYAFLTQGSTFIKNPTKANYREYGRAMFSYDLYSLKKRAINRYEMITITARRGETRNRYDTLWIPGSSGRGVGELISGIKFRETFA